MIDETIVRELFDKWPDTTGATISIPADYEYWRAVQWYAWRSAFDVAYRMGAERAEQEAASLRADAERYRWLREHRTQDDDCDGWLSMHFDVHATTDSSSGRKLRQSSPDERKSALDAAVDAARKA
jgi:hypothetical protein